MSPKKLELYFWKARIKIRSLFILFAKWINLTDMHIDGSFLRALWLQIIFYFVSSASYIAQTFSPLRVSDKGNCWNCNFTSDSDLFHSVEMKNSHCEYIFTYQSGEMCIWRWKCFTSYTRTLPLVNVLISRGGVNRIQIKETWWESSNHHRLVWHVLRFERCAVSFPIVLVVRVSPCNWQGPIVQQRSYLSHCHPCLLSSKQKKERNRYDTILKQPFRVFK